MASSTGISGTAVALTTVGGVLVWAALANREPQDIAREVLGLPTSRIAVGPAFESVQSGVRGIGKGLSGGVEGVGAAAGGIAAALVANARAQLGVRYVWAKSSPAEGFDCSGLVVYCLRQAGAANVPRFTTVTFGRWAAGAGWTRIATGFQPGDVVLKTGHMGIATGPKTMIAAPHPGSVVKESAIAPISQWWGWRYIGIPAQPGPGQRDPGRG